MTRIAIMQPTFLPWLGYFALIDAVDHFVFLDDVQFSRPSWQNRNRIKGPNGPIMLTLPIARKPSNPMIKYAKIATTGFERKLFASIKNNLGNAPFFALVSHILNTAFATADHNLNALNADIIKGICSATKLTTPFTFSSNLELPHGNKSDHVYNICQAMGADTYLSPLGSLDYLETENPFKSSPIGLEFQNYQHPEYNQQFNGFASHMAAIDALANLGPDLFIKTMRQGVLPPFDISAALENRNSDE